MGRFLVGLERAAARAALAVLGKASTAGRRGRTIENAVRLRLHSLSQGSIVAELEIPEPDFDELNLGLETRTLGEQAIDKTLDTARGEEGANPDVAEAFALLITELAIGERYESAWLERVEPLGTRVVIDHERALRLKALAVGPAVEPRPDRIGGTLVEADFEKRTARLRTPAGKPVVVQFGDDLADEIQTALRRPAELEGRLFFDPRTSLATSVELRQIRRADQLVFGALPDGFWLNPTVEQLRQERGVQPVSDLSLLRDATATDDEIDAFMRAIEE